MTCLQISLLQSCNNNKTTAAVTAAATATAITTKQTYKNVKQTLAKFRHARTEVCKKRISFAKKRFLSETRIERKRKQGSISTLKISCKKELLVKCW